MLGRRSAVVGAVVLVVVLVVGLATTFALQAANDLTVAREQLLAARESSSGAQDTAHALRRADERATAADEALSRWPVDVVAAVPVLGRSWAAERAVARTAAELLDAARVVTDGLSSVRASAGGVDLEALARLREDLEGPAERSTEAYGALDRQPLGFTPPQVSAAVTQAREALGPAVAALQQADDGLSVVSGLLGGDGPRSVLVMLQNNAELRGTGGYTSSFATGRTQDGRLLLDPLQDLIQVADPPDQDRYLPAPDEYVEDFRVFGGNSTMWRTWNMSPHVPDSALVGTRIAGAVLGQEPDVLLLLDVPAMGALAALGGTAITLPDGSEVQPEELTESLLVDSYAAAGQDVEAQIRRRLQLQAAATVAVTRLLDGDVPAPDLARSLVRLADRRHLAVWSARADEQEALERIGVAGQVQAGEGADLAHVSVNNIGANKLDLYVDRQVSISAVVGRTSATVVQRVRFTNTAPEGLVPYVAGVQWPSIVVSRAELSLSPAAHDLVATIDGKPWRGGLHTGGGRSRLFTRVELPRGSSTLLEARYRVPVEDGRYELQLVPQPLVEDASLELSIRGADGHRLSEVSGAELEGGHVSESGVLTGTRDVVAVVRARTPTRWERLRDWWNSPVELG